MQKSKENAKTFAVYKKRRERDRTIIGHAGRNGAAESSAAVRRNRA